jgi:hypothetical protein
VAGLALFAAPASANHPVLVEGNNGSDLGPGNSIVPPGTSGDFDGDGRVGVAEDTDNATDRIFGTISAALLADHGGANANGHVIIVTSGRFPEQIRVPNPSGAQYTVNGTTVIEAAPGVQANIDAVLQGDPGNATRQTLPGVLINSSATDRSIVLRNLVIRNWGVGLLATANSRVTVTNCRFDSNLLNLQIRQNSRVAIADSSVSAGGLRFNPAPPPAGANGGGILVQDTASASISGSTITNNGGVGIRNTGSGTVRVRDSNVFDNNPDLQGTIDSA